MKALIYIMVISFSLGLGIVMNNTFFRAHYLGIGRKLTIDLTLKGTECSLNECELTLSDDLDPHSMYVIKWQGKMLNLENKVKALFIINEHGALCLIELSDGYVREDFSHLSFCYTVLKISEEEWNKSRPKLNPN